LIGKASRVSESPFQGRKLMRELTGREMRAVSDGATANRPGVVSVLIIPPKSRIGLVLSGHARLMELGHGALNFLDEYVERG
jgi:hypothetical protein